MKYQAKIQGNDYLEREHEEESGEEYTDSNALVMY